MAEAKKKPAKKTNGIDKDSRGRRCLICKNPDAAKINTLIAKGSTYRNISQLYGMDIASVFRHIHNCLKLDMQTLVEEKRVTQAVNVYEEFQEQLAFAKDLRAAARKYLSDVDDPLQMSITPKAHEIEVTYFDHNDMETIGFGDNAVERPKKKKAQLSVILEAIFAEGNLEPEKFSVKTIDIRKFALDAIATADLCIDRFAKMGGLYTQEQRNIQDTIEIANKVVDRLVLEKGWSEAEARTEVGRMYQLPEWVSDADN